MVKITVLSDNSCSKELKSEFGFSVFIEIGYNTYLFDTGASDVFLQNALDLQLDIQNCKNVIISHGHWDHGNGMHYLKNKNVFLHSMAFKQRFKTDGSSIGLSYSLDECAKNNTINFINESALLFENIFFITNLKSDMVLGNYFDSNGVKDLIEDDSSLAIKTSKGLVLISGCAHKGIEEHIKKALEISGEKFLYSIIGGLHISSPLEAEALSDVLLKFVKGTIYTGHCTKREAMLTLGKYVPVQQIYTGFDIIF